MAFKLTASEVATVQALREVAPTFVPPVYVPEGHDREFELHACLTKVHRLPFFFVDRLGNAEDEDTEEDDEVTDERLRRTVKDIARLMSQISTISFSGVGSPTFDDNGKVVVGPLHTPHSAEHPADALGLYRTSAELKLALLEQNMRFVREKRRWWDWRWNTIRSQFDPVWAYIIYLEGREIVQSVAEMQVEEPTYLRHGDDHQYQFLLNDDGSLAGVIDWEL